MKRTALLLALPLALAGCLETSTPGPQTVVRYQADLAADPAQFTTPVITAAESQTQPGVIVVNGAFTSPDGCRELQPEASNSGASIEVSIAIRPDPVAGCRTTPTVIRYELQVGTFEEASWTLRILHRYPDQPAAPGNGQVFQGTVVI